MSPVGIALLILAFCVGLIILIACVFQRCTQEEKLEYFETVDQLPQPVPIEDTGKNIIPLVTFNTVQNHHKIIN
jgi:hypothetical protein